MQESPAPNRLAGLEGREGKHMQGNGSGAKPSRLWYLLLLPPYIAMFLVSSYNKAEPAWAGIPFFYWYQLLWILIGAVLTVIVYFATRSRDH